MDGRVESHHVGCHPQSVRVEEERLGGRGGGSETTSNLLSIDDDDDDDYDDHSAYCKVPYHDYQYFDHARYAHTLSVSCLFHCHLSMISYNENGQKPHPNRQNLEISRVAPTKLCCHSSARAPKRKIVGFFKGGKVTTKHTEPNFFYMGRTVYLPIIYP